MIYRDERGTASKGMVYDPAVIGGLAVWRHVELTDGCYSGGDFQGLPGFIHPRVLGIPTISFQ